MAHLGKPYLLSKLHMAWFLCFLAQFPVYLTIISLVLVAYEMIITNYHLISNKREWSNCLKRPQNAELTKLKTPQKLKRTLTIFLACK